jgi:hypothetical protein
MSFFSSSYDLFTISCFATNTYLPFFRFDVFDFSRQSARSLLLILFRTTADPIFLDATNARASLPEV